MILFGINKQSGTCRSPKIVALFSATNFSSYITELPQLHDAIQIKLNYAPIQKWYSHNKSLNDIKSCLKIHFCHQI